METNDDLEKDRREFEAQRRAAEREHAMNCPGHVRDQAHEIADCVLPQKI